MENQKLNNEPEDADVEVSCHARVSAGRSPSERSLHSCTLQSIEGCRVVYLYGGRNKGGVALDDLHTLDLEANFWSCKQAAQPTAMEDMSLEQLAALVDGEEDGLM